MTPSHTFACTLAALSLVALHAAARADSDKEKDRDRNIVVDCAAGDTIAGALRHRDHRKSILIKGTCIENVAVDRDDITLAAAAAGATISGADPATDVIRITGSRVTIDGITVTGGRNGISALGASNFTVSNAVVQGTGRTGIASDRGASGVIDRSLVTGNARDGIAIDAGSATVTNSQVTQNGRMGIGVFNGGSARIGVDNFNNPAGNTVSTNAANGVHIVFGASAFMAANQITGNGTNPPPGINGNGVNIASATADLIGGNTISGNVGAGINITRSTAVLGDTLFGAGIPTVNIITGNGNPASIGGIFLFNGSSVTIRDAVISNNVGVGLILSLKSSGQIVSTTIVNNLAPGGDGIRLTLGSGLLPQAGIPPEALNGSVSGNAGFGLLCTDLESSVVNTALLGIDGNGLGTVAGCTGF